MQRKRVSKFIACGTYMEEFPFLVMLRIAWWSQVALEDRFSCLALFGGFGICKT
jgi:hypothetical protein